MKISFVNNFSNLNRTQNKTSFKRAPGMTGNSNGPSQPNYPKDSLLKKFVLSDFLYTLVIGHILISAPLAHKLANKAIDEELAKFEMPAPKNDDLKKLVDNPEYSKAFYQLSKLRDIDKPDVKKVSDNVYLAKLNLEGKNLVVTMFTGELDENKLSGFGSFVGDGSESFEYSAAINPDNTKTVEVEFAFQNDSLANKKKVKKVFVRDIDGELSIVENGKKTVINKQAAESFKMVRKLNNQKNDMNRDYAESRDSWYLFGMIITLLKMRMKKDDDEADRKLLDI